MTRQRIPGYIQSVPAAGSRHSALVVTIFVPAAGPVRIPTPPPRSGRYAPDTLRLLPCLPQVRRKPYRARTGWLLRHRVRAGRPVEDAEIGEHAGFGSPVDENEFGKTASDVGARKYIRGHILCH
jgi:hypothetical protein